MTCCDYCDGTGMRDTGGVQPWGEPIFIPCECEEIPTVLKKSVDIQISPSYNNPIDQEAQQ